MPLTDEFQKRFLKTLDNLSYGHSGVLNDWAEMSAIALCNGVTGAIRKDDAWQAREKRYLDIVKRYKKEEVTGLQEMFHCVIESLSTHLHDCLGEMYMSEELRSSWDSDVCFTPWPVSHMMAKMTFGDNPIPDKGYITIAEPAAGTGGMVIAAAQALADLKLNYQKSMWVQATEIRAPLAHMTYIQLSLLHIPAAVVHGDTLKMESWSTWYTPAHYMGLWQFRLRRDQQKQAAIAEPIPTVETPAPKGQFTFDFGKVEECRKSSTLTGSSPRIRSTSLNDATRSSRNIRRRVSR